MKMEYVFTVLPGDNIQSYLNARGQEGYRLANIQPARKKINEEIENNVPQTVETVTALLVTMEREIS